LVYPTHSDVAVAIDAGAWHAGLTAKFEHVLPVGVPYDAKVMAEMY